MPPRKRRKPRKAAVTGLTWQRGRAVWQRQHPRLPGGGVVIPLATREPELGAERAQALNTLMDRGDWGVLARVSARDIHVTDVVHAVREGEYARLKRLNIEGTLLGPACDEFLRVTAATGKPATYRQYDSLLGILRRRLTDEYPMALLTTQLAQEILHEPKPTNGNAPWAPRTMSAARTVYGALWRMVIRNEREAARTTGAVPALTENPWREAKLPRARRTRHSFLLPQEWRDLIAHPAVDGTPTAALLALACLAGLRLQEIVNLRPEIDIDFEGGRIRVQDREGERDWTTKTENGVRDVPMVGALRAILLRHIALGFSARRYLIHAAGRDAPLSSSAVQDWVKRAFTAAGLRYGREGEALTLHSLRHTYATWMVSAGVPIPTVAKRLGDTPEMVLGTYAHHMPTDEQRPELVIEAAAGGAA